MLAKILEERRRDSAREKKLCQESDGFNFTHFCFEAMKAKQLIRQTEKRPMGDD
jgi:hypothetical protein